MKRILSLCLVLTLCVSLLAGVTMPASAAESGTCGANLTWILDDNGTLTISGTGAMSNYVHAYDAPWYNYSRRIKDIIIEDGVTSIGNYAFLDCRSLKTITIPACMTSIGGHAFYYCSALTDVYFGADKTAGSKISIGNDNRYFADATWHYVQKGTCGDDLTWILDHNGTLTVSGTGAMWDYTSLSYASWYSDRRSIKTVIIENGVASIGDKVFYDCTAITEITIPGSVMGIGYSAFYNCYGLTEITIPDSVTSVGEFAFSECYGLTEIAIPDSVTSIGYYAFYGCESLTDVYYGGDETDRSKISIGSNNEYLTNATWHYPEQQTISIFSVKGGTVSSDRMSTIKGKTVTLSATPNAGYEFVTFLVDGVAISGNTFTMPNRAVTVSATFKAIDHTVSVEECENGSVSVDKSIAGTDETVTVTATPNVGYELSKIFVNGKEISGNTFTMPAEDVTVSALFELGLTLSTINGAQIRTSGAQGLRFISSIDKTSLDFDRVVEYGTVLIPSADITDISELQIDATLNGHTVAKVPANFLYAEDDESITFTAVITNIAEKNYAREYTARAYAMMDDGTVVYAESGASRSIYTVAKRGLDNQNELEVNKELFRKIVLAVEGTSSGDSGIY